jgi:hypothetical protein
VGQRNPEFLDRVLVVTYSDLGSNLSRRIFADHPEIWFWQPYSLKLVAEKYSTLDLVIQQANALVDIT